MKAIAIYLLVQLGPVVCGANKKVAAIKSGVPWYDTDGNLVDAHGAGLLEHESKFYWYGSRRFVNATGTQMDGGIALYSSEDLYSWKYERLVLPVFNCTDNNTGTTSSLATGTVEYRDKDGTYPPPSCANGNGLDLERPKVVQCGGPGNGGKFVMWVRGTGYGNTPQLLGVLTADSPTGPFTFVSNRTGSDDPFHPIAVGIKNLPSGYQYADATLYQDPATFKTYVYWRTRMTNGLDGSTGFRGMELTDDCRDVIPGTDTRITATPNREGPAMFKHDGTYYLWCSGTMGWSPTEMYLYSASTPLGNFSASSQLGHQWHSYTKGVKTEKNYTQWNKTWTVRDGYLAYGSPFGKASSQNLTLPAAKAICAASSACAGFCFNSYARRPADDTVLPMMLKTIIDYVQIPDPGLQPSPIPNPGAPGNVAPAQPGAWAFDSQSTYIVANPKFKKGSRLAPFVYLGDRWNFSNTLGTSTATYIWLPLYVDPRNPRSVMVVWADEWKLDDDTLYPF